MTKVKKRSDAQVAVTSWKSVRDNPRLAEMDRARLAAREAAEEYHRVVEEQLTTGLLVGYRHGNNVVQAFVIATAGNRVLLQSVRTNKEYWIDEYRLVDRLIQSHNAGVDVESTRPGGVQPSSS